MSTNFLSSVYCTHFALPFLKKTQGQIVAIISLAGLVGLPSLSAYCASKYAMVGFFDTLRAELIGSGVTVTADYTSSPLATAALVTTRTWCPAWRSSATSTQTRPMASREMTPRSSVSEDVPIFAITVTTGRNPIGQSNANVKSAMCTMSPLRAPARASALSTPIFVSW